MRAAHPCRLLLAGLALIFGSCGGGEENVEGVRKGDELIGGQIFIVTKGGENVKLGLVSVSVLDEEAAEELRAAALKRADDMLEDVDAYKEWEIFEALWLPGVLLKADVLSLKKATTKTDADGRFLFSPPSDRFALVAQGSRLAGGDEESYEWVVVFERDEVGPSGILLSNDNMAGGSVNQLLPVAEARVKFEQAKQRAKQRAEQWARDVENARKVGDQMAVPTGEIDMLWCPPGTFQVGSPEGEEDREDDETLHAVTLSRGFWLGKHEVTQGQWEKVMGSNPSLFKGPNRPVEMVSREDAAAFCKKLTELERKAGRVPEVWAYQLPTEAQWEYACRAGTRTRFSFGDEAAKLHQYGNYADKNTDFAWSDEDHDDGHEDTAPVGSYKPNAWGFHDMHGNVWEWCRDWYDSDYYEQASAKRDPLGPASGSARVLRGGSWSHTGASLRSAERYGHTPGSRYNTLGFRVGFKASQ